MKKIQKSKISVLTKLEILKVGNFLPFPNRKFRK